MDRVAALAAAGRVGVLAGAAVIVFINEHNDYWVDVHAFSAKLWLCVRSDVADRITTLLIRCECICVVAKEWHIYMHDCAAK